MEKKIEFIPNEKDNLHCIQACYAMVNNLLFDEELTAVEVEKATNFRESFPTWQFGAIRSFAKRGLKVKSIENFPIEGFLGNPSEAIKTQFKDEDVVNSIISVTDFELELSTIREALGTKNVQFEQRIPNLKDIEVLLSEGWELICNVNYWLLQGIKDKYAGHFVVIKEINNENIILNNPGLPPIENQIVMIEDFLCAWNFPNENAANLIAVKRNHF